MPVPQFWRKRRRVVDRIESRTGGGSEFMAARKEEGGDSG
jgi:hypothetical protein